MGLLRDAIGGLLGVGFDQLDDWFDRMIADGRQEEAFAVAQNLDRDIQSKLIGQEQVFIDNPDLEPGTAEAQNLLAPFRSVDLGQIENIHKLANSPVASQIAVGGLNNFNQSSPLAIAQAQQAERFKLADKTAAGVEGAFAKEGLTGPEQVRTNIINKFTTSPTGEQRVAHVNTQKDLDAQRQANKQIDVAQRKKALGIGRKTGGGGSGKGANNPEITLAYTIMTEGEINTYGDPSTPQGKAFIKVFNANMKAQGKERDPIAAKLLTIEQLSKMEKVQAQQAEQQFQDSISPEGIEQRQSEALRQREEVLRQRAIESPPPTEEPPTPQGPSTGQRIRQSISGGDEEPALEPLPETEAVSNDARGVISNRIGDNPTPEEKKRWIEKLKARGIKNPQQVFPQLR